MSEISEFAVTVLKQYAKEQSELVRGTTDTSKLEQWLIMQLFKNDKSLSSCAGVSLGGSQPVQTAGKELKLKNSELSELYPLQINLVNDNNELKFIKAANAEDRNGVVYYRHDFAKWIFNKI